MDPPPPPPPPEASFKSPPPASWSSVGHNQSWGKAVSEPTAGLGPGPPRPPGNVLSTRVREVTDKGTEWCPFPPSLPALIPTGPSAPPIKPLVGIGGKRGHFPPFTNKALEGWGVTAQSPPPAWLPRLPNLRSTQRIASTAPPPPSGNLHLGC